ncbi:unnamed protein product [Rotaria magnacalcarata]|uniref:HAT C-terminal dimerisation domain-containing protein n=1 Tax=Rotaria magnacalcarata TaxID=392030 RepID=A0A816VFX7_9BILA|nr:unnamed protein product [Rotaria magnacalcarata]
MMRKYPLILAYTCVLVFALKSRRATKYIMDLTKSQLIDLLLLLAPLNAALHSIQTDETPSLHLVIPFCQKLLQDYSTYSKLVSSAKKKYPLIFNSSFVADYLLNESSGVQFFRQPKCLHPALREMDGVSSQLKYTCYDNIRAYLQEKRIDAVSVAIDCATTSNKKRKLLHKFLDEDEADECNEVLTEISINENNFDTNYDEIDLPRKNDIGRRRLSSASSLSTEFSYRTNYQAPKPDELDEYLESDINSSLVTDNPLHFWSIQLATIKFPVLKCLARKLYSIPATSAGTERLFSYSGIILNNRRQRLSPDQLDNILVIRGARKVLGHIQKSD